MERLAHQLQIWHRYAVVEKKLKWPDVKFQPFESMKKDKLIDICKTFELENSGTRQILIDKLLYNIPYRE